MVLGVCMTAAEVTAQDARPQYGITVSAESVYVGDPFRVVVRVRAPAGTTILFPAGPDTTGPVQPLDPPLVAVIEDTTDVVDETVTFRVAAWDVGRQEIPLGELRLQTQAGDRRITLPSQSIFVRSVLPADSAERVPKPPRPIYETLGAPLWPWLLLAAAAMAALLVWWLRRRRRARDGHPAETAFDEAERHFRRVEALELVAAGERGRHVALMTDIARRYLARRVEGVALAYTTSELVGVLRHDPLVPVARLAALLEEADLVKFARRPVSAERAISLGHAARDIVARTESGIRASEEAARDAASRREAA
jgi:hypothetical protein